MRTPKSGSGGGSQVYAASNCGAPFAFIMGVSPKVHVSTVLFPEVTLNMSVNWPPRRVTRDVVAFASTCRAVMFKAAGAAGEVGAATVCVVAVCAVVAAADLVLVAFAVAAGAATFFWAVAALAVEEVVEEAIFGLIITMGRRLAMAAFALAFAFAAVVAAALAKVVEDAGVPVSVPVGACVRMSEEKIVLMMPVCIAACETDGRFSGSVTTAVRGPVMRPPSATSIPIMNLDRALAIAMFDAMSIPWD